MCCILFGRLELWQQLCQPSNVLVRCAMTTKTNGAFVKVETQPIVQKYSKEGFLKAPWCLIKRFFHFIALSFWRSYPRSLISLPFGIQIHVTFCIWNFQENWFSKIFHHSLETFLCVCVFPLQALVWNWGLFIWTIWLFRLGSLLPPLNLHPSYPSDTYNSYRVELCSCIDVNIDNRDWC